jgi:Ca2+-binding RTX toxin-like protein
MRGYSRGSMRLATLAGLSVLACAVFATPAFAAPPPNDDFPGTTLSGNMTGATGTNVEATHEAGEPAHAGVGNTNSVWYSWTAPAAGKLDINLCGSDYDTALAVYTGAAVDMLTEVASDDDSDTCGLQSRVLFLATAGTTYRIAVDGFFGSTGNIDLNLEFTPSPPSAPGTVTIGSRLNSNAVSSIGCTATCTQADTTLPADRTASGGLVAPFDGTVVRWRIKTGDTVDSPVALRILRPGAMDPTAAAGTGPAETPPINDITTFPVNLPVQAGDSIGVDCCGSGDTVMIQDSPATPLSIWQPTLADGAAARPSDLQGIDIELLISADIVPKAAPAAATCRGEKATIIGTDGPDNLKGTSGHDVIQGLGGDDGVTGLGGSDLLCGGNGADRLKGGDAADVLIGGPGSDLLRGGKAVDRLFGGSPGTGAGGAGAGSNVLPGVRDRCPKPGPDHHHGCRVG